MKWNNLGRMDTTICIKPEKCQEVIKICQAYYTGFSSEPSEKDIMFCENYFLIHIVRMNELLKRFNL